MKKIIAILILFQVQNVFASGHAITMFGDAPKYGKDFTHFEYANPSAPKGGEVKFASIGTFDSLNAHILKGVPASGLGYLYDSLTVSSSDETFSKYGLLAEKIEVAEDKKSVTFTLRSSAKWHDGKAITADDVVFSFETITKKGHPFYRSYYTEVESAEKLADNKVRFNFATNKNRELPLIIGDLPILPKHYYTNPDYANRDFAKTTLEAPLGSGPYKIDSFEAGKWIKYSRVKDYWGKDLPVNKGKYNFDAVQYDYYRDATVAVEAFKGGEYDFRQENISKVWANSYNIPQVEDGRIIKEELNHSIPTGMQAFVFNTRRHKFADVRVREAITHAFDFEWTNKNLFNGAYSRTKSYFSNSDYASSGLPSAAELELLKPFKASLSKEIFNTEYLPPKTDGSGRNRANLRIAKKLLDEVAKNSGDMGLAWHMKDGKLQRKLYGPRDEFLGYEEFEIEFLLNSPSFERVVAPVIKNLKKLGIIATMRTVDAAQYIKRVEEFDFDMVVNVFGQSNSPGNEQFDYWHSSRADVKGSRNLAGVHDGAVDAMVEKIVGAHSKAEMVTATKALDRILLHGAYVVPNWHIKSFRLVYWNKLHRPEITPKYSLGTDFWWVDKKK